MADRPSTVVCKQSLLLLQEEQIFLLDSTANNAWRQAVPFNGWLGVEVFCMMLLQEFVEDVITLFLLL